MTAQEALAYIHSVSWMGSIPGLSRTRELLRRMGDPQEKLRFIHIAGTNGKGSTAAMLHAIFACSGYVTGLYTSPYIRCFHERMQVNGEMITDDELAEITGFVKQHAEVMQEHPTEFELVTAIAMEYFYRHGCQIVVLEVGMGGELDSTNVISTPEVAVITNIGLDHTGVLGDTLEQIAQAKAGIIKGGDAVLYRSQASVEAVIAKRCSETATTLHDAEFDALHLHWSDFSGQCFDCGARKNLFLSLLGEHQLKNAAVVLKTVDVLRQKGWSLPEEKICEALRNVRWPGRFELLSQEPIFFVDGGHNPQCMQALAENVRRYLPNKRIIALTGVMQDKDHLQMYRILAPYVAHWIAVRPDNPRAMAAQELAQELSVFGKPVQVCQSVPEGVRQALALCESDAAAVAFGSLYMVGEIRDCFA